jgi:hypothetical protein
MRSLVPCSSCNRHVEAAATACPFCGAALVPQPDTRVCSGPCAGHAHPRLGRAAMAAIGATLLCASCIRGSATEYGTAVVTGGHSGDTSGQTGGAGGQVDGAAGGAGGQRTDASADASPDAANK